MNLAGCEVLRPRPRGSGLYERFYARDGDELVEVRRIWPQYAVDEALASMARHTARLHQLVDDDYAQRAVRVEDGCVVLRAWPGASLRAVAERSRAEGGHMPVEILAALARGMTRALAALHALVVDGEPANVVHRAVAPESFTLSWEGRVRIAELELPRSSLQEEQTAPGMLKGRFAYMAPEVVRGRPFDQRADLFTLGTCLYELATGANPFVRDSDFGTLEAIYNLRVPALDHPLADVIARLLVTDPDDRTPAARAVLDALPAGVEERDLGRWAAGLLGVEDDEAFVD